MPDQTDTDGLPVEEESVPSEPTIDGRRLRLDELNIPPLPAESGWWQRIRRNLSLFVAGMYTGESCAGTPHRERRRRNGDPRQR